MATSKIKLRLNQQQIELIDNTIRSGETNSRDDLVRRALREFAKANLPTAGKRQMTSTERKLLQELIIQPGTGKALELRRGQILRIAQIDRPAMCGLQLLQSSRLQGILPHRPHAPPARHASDQRRFPLVGASARAADDGDHRGYRRYQ